MGESKLNKQGYINSMNASLSRFQKEFDLFIEELQGRVGEIDFRTNKGKDEALQLAAQVYITMSSTIKGMNIYRYNEFIENSDILVKEIRVEKPGDERKLVQEFLDKNNLVEEDIHIEKYYGLLRDTLQPEITKDILLEKRNKNYYEKKEIIVKKAKENKKAVLFISIFIENSEI